MRDFMRGFIAGRGRGVARGIALAAFAALAVACPAGIEVAAPSQEPGTGTGVGGGTGTGTGSGTATGGGGTGSTSSAILGRWTRAILFSDDAGNVHESRTTWEFRQDGSAIRTVTAWNITSGVHDTLVSVAQWRTSGSTLTITYLTPTTGTASFSWRVDGTRLTIGADEFTRIS